MIKSIKYLLLGFLFIGFGDMVQAKVLLPQILSSGMVLQRDKPINIWGFADPGEKISVEFAGQIKTTIADSKGNWIVVLAPLKTSEAAQTMRIVGTNKIMLTNILVGEVWVCSGQSNMEYAMRKLIKIPTPLNEKLGFPQNEVATAKNHKIRIFLVNRKQLSKPDSIHKSWSVAQDSALRAFSAVGYFFAKELQQKLGVPVGIIESAVSGSAIEPWIDQNAFAMENYFKDKKVGNDPGKFYTPMIEPLSLFKIRGFLWYQGETNCFLNENIGYAYKMKALINSWRKAWNDGNLPFYYVQIAPYNYSKQKGQVILNENTEPEFWEAQAQLLRMPNTGMVVTTDLNDNGEDLHPTYKWEVGRRLSLWALAKTYGQDITYSGPIYKKKRVFEQYVVLSFDHIAFSISKNRDEFEGFEIAGKDGKFVKAKAFQKGYEVCVKSELIKNPTAVRYNWTENPLGNFYSNNLLALPFRTNNPLTDNFKPNK
jgi:sialate O-acetylesterase